MQKELHFSCGEGRYQICLTAVITRDGISAVLTGGETPHVGGSAMSVPRSGHPGDKIRCDTWITPRPGHRDAELAARVAQMICADTGQAAAVVAGIHIDGAIKKEIDLLEENSRDAARLLINKYKEVMR